jgi:hypothetical protein
LRLAKEALRRVDDLLKSGKNWVVDAVAGLRLGLLIKRW